MAEREVGGEERLADSESSVSFVTGAPLPVLRRKRAAKASLERPGLERGLIAEEQLKGLLILGFCGF